MPLAGINTGTIASAIALNAVQPLMLPDHAAITIYRALAWQMPGSAAKITIPHWENGEAIVGVKPEAEEFTPEDLDADDREIAPAMVGRSFLYTDEVAAQQGIVTLDGGVSHVLELLDRRINKDILALHSSMSNHTNNNGVKLTLDLFDAALALYRLQYPTQPRLAFVCSLNQSRDLRAAVRSSSGGQLTPGAGLSIFNLPTQGFVGVWQGVEIWEGDVPQQDADNDRCAFVCAPMPGMNEAGQVNAGATYGLGVWIGRRGELQREAGRTGTKAVISAYYGVGITDQENAHSVSFRKAA